jgi:hypothetical protein
MRPKSSRRVIFSGVLALVLPVLVVLAEVPVLHAHQGEGLGLYDGECPSWRLATSAGGLGPSPAHSPVSAGPYCVEDRGTPSDL